MVNEKRDSVTFNKAEKCAFKKKIEKFMFLWLAFQLAHAQTSLTLPCN